MNPAPGSRIPTPESGVFDLVIRNGTVVTPTASRRADVGIRDGRIAAVGAALGPANATIEAADRLVFFDEGQIVESAPPDDFFGNPKEERTKLFLSQILTH